MVADMIPARMVKIGTSSANVRRILLLTISRAMRATKTASSLSRWRLVSVAATCSVITNPIGASRVRVCLAILHFRLRRPRTTMLSMAQVVKADVTTAKCVR